MGHAGVTRKPQIEDEYHGAVFQLLVETPSVAGGVEEHEVRRLPAEQRMGFGRNPPFRSPIQHVAQNGALVPAAAIVSQIFCQQIEMDDPASMFSGSRIKTTSCHISQ